MSVTAFQAIYPQVPIETEFDAELLWKEEFEFKSLERKFYWEKHGKEAGDSLFFNHNPEWFGYIVLGRDFLAKQSKSRKFSMFMPFQVDFMLSFLDPNIFKMGIIACRGGAKSWLNAYCSAMDCTINNGMEISMLGGSEKQSQGTFEYARAMVDDPECGIYPLIEHPTTKKEIIFKPRNGLVSKIFNLAASETSVRGPRSTKVICDEITRIDEDTIESFIGQAITSPNFKFVWGGTPDKPGHMAHSWWCTKPENVVLRDGRMEKCHHWVNYNRELPHMSWHLFHWDAYDCHVNKGGWIHQEAIDALKTIYRSVSKQRREIYGKWTSDTGNILRFEDIESAISGFNLVNLPKTMSEYQGIIVSVDGARHSHYSTIVIIGFVNNIAHVLYAKGWEDITEAKLRSHVLNAVAHFKDSGTKTVLVIEEAPISATLIDNCRKACVDMHVNFFTSTFKHRKNRYVENIIEYFELGLIKIPSGLTQLIDELFIWRWAKNSDRLGRRLPEKGNDDFIDALMHALMKAYVILKNDRKDNKLHSGAKRNERSMGKAIRFFNFQQNGGEWKGSINSF